MRLKVSRSKNSASYYVTKSVYVDGVEKTITVEKLGTEKDLLEKLDGEDPYTWAKEYVRKRNKEEAENRRKVIARFSPVKPIDMNTHVLFQGGYLFLQDIYYRLKLNHICHTITAKYKFQFDLNEILSHLIYGRILFPSSKKAMTELSANFLEEPSFNLHQVYRALDALAKESDIIQAQLYKNSLMLCNRNTKVLYYDCTNFYFEIEEEAGLKQYGKGKENRPNPIVSMGLFMDGTGIPLAFSIHSGNTNDQVTLKPLEKKILKDFELSPFVVCTDAGLAATPNRRFNNIQGRAFITTQSVKKLKKHLKEWALDPADWKWDRQDQTSTNKRYHLDQVKEFYHSEDRTPEERAKLSEKVFYKERWIKEDGLEQRLIVTFSLKYSNYQKRIRNGQIERAAKTITSNPTKLKKCNANDYRRFVKKEHCTPDGEIAEHEILSIDQDVISAEAIYDGFYAVCTNLEDTAKEIVKANKKRWEIEDCFRIMKSELEARPVYLQRDQRILAHFMTCFIALIIYRLLEHTIMPTPESDEKYTCQTILTTLKSMNFYKLPGEGYIPAYQRTDLTDALHDAFGFRTDYQIVSTSNLKKIIKKTKTAKKVRTSE
jgi:transposase